MYAEVVKIYSKNESSILEIVKKEKNVLVLLSHLKLPHAAVHGKCLVKMEKALNLWMGDMNRKHVPIGGNILPKKALSLYKGFSKGSSKTSDTNQCK